MAKIFQFGQDIQGYDFRVINERDARASAGIMFLLGIISLFSFIMTKNLFWAELFSITFIIEFVVRVFINPIYAPYMLLGSFMVSNQEPEWVEASPKKFAWILGVILGLIMTYFIIGNILSPARLLICILCLILLFLESAFSICLGCIMYKRLNKKLYKCPGGVCEVSSKKESAKGAFVVLLVFMALFYGTYYGLKEYKYAPKIEHSSKTIIINNKSTENMSKLTTIKNKESDKDCTPPQWAIDMGHKNIWLEHHGCK
jgi:hypothetical protein